MKAHEKNVQLYAAIEQRVVPLFLDLGFVQKRKRHMRPGDRGPYALRFRRQRGAFTDQLDYLFRSAGRPQFVVEWMCGEPGKWFPDVVRRGPKKGQPAASGIPVGRIYRGPKRFFSLSSEAEWFRWERDLDREMAHAEAQIRRLDAYLKCGQPMQWISNARPDGRISGP